MGFDAENDDHGAREDVTRTRVLAVDMLYRALIPLVMLPVLLSGALKGVVLASVVLYAVGIDAQDFVRDAASHVNVFVGTTNGGHVFPGEHHKCALVPMGGG